MDDVPMFIFDKYFSKRAEGLLNDYEAHGRAIYLQLGI